MLFLPLIEGLATGTGGGALPANLGGKGGAVLGAMEDRDSVEGIGGADAFPMKELVEFDDEDESLQPSLPGIIYLANEISTKIFVSTAYAVIFESTIFFRGALTARVWVSVKTQSALQYYSSVYILPINLLSVRPFTGVTSSTWEQCI
jgi:hypothetical protein